MPLLIGLFLAALTLPVWGGALAAVVGGGLMLFVHYPVPMIVGTVLLFLLAAR